MGLTIHYRLRLDSPSVELVKQKLTALRDVAFKLSFAEVGELIELKGQDCVFDRNNRDDAYSWIKLHASKYVDQGKSFSSIPAEHMIAFSTWPGEGCESAIFGLAMHPPQDATPVEYWSWSSFCKTQYASNPEYGGAEHFLSCHLRVIQMLDAAQQLGILKNVSDEGKYWEKRDTQLLLESVGEYNALVAAVVGRLGLGELAGKQVYAPIAEFPNFEYLEAEGCQQISENRRNKSDASPDVE